tara:strand:- start:44 stop:553 length:510 start_codon:yes stop_codon:yes gene_type:complete
MSRESYGGGGQYGGSSSSSSRGNGGRNGGRNGGGNNFSSILSNAMKFSIAGNLLKGLSSLFKNEKNLKQAKKDDALGGEMLTREKRNLTSGGGEGRYNNSNVTIPLIKNSLTTTMGIAPTAAEVSQSKAADAYDLRKTKARGRSMTILTKPTGLKDDTLTLGRKSLLGR